MVAEDAHVVAQGVEHGILHLAPKDIEKQCSLHIVAGVHHQHVLVARACFVKDGAATEDSTHVILCHGVDLAVCVVRRQDDEVLGIHHRCHTSHQRRTQQQFLEFVHKGSWIKKLII